MEPRDKDRIILNK